MWKQCEIQPLLKVQPQVWDNIGNLANGLRNFFLYHFILYPRGVPIAGIWQHPAWKSDLHYNNLGRPSNTMQFRTILHQANPCQHLQWIRRDDITSWRQHCQYHSKSWKFTCESIFCPIRILVWEMILQLVFGGVEKEQFNLLLLLSNALPSHRT